MFSFIVGGGDPVVVLAPVRLHQRGVDVGGGDGGGLGAHRLHQAGGGEVDGVAQDERFNGIGREGLQQLGVGSSNRSDAPGSTPPRFTLTSLSKH